MTTSKTVNITEIPLDPKDTTKTTWGSLLSDQYYFVIANGGADGETFDAADISSAAKGLMTTYSRGLAVNMGAGDDTVTGSDYVDSINGGAGTNYIDGGDNKVPAGSAKGRDSLNVFAADKAAADALSVTALSAQSTGADGAAFAAGYRIKVSNGSETDYLKNVETVDVFVASGASYAYAKSFSLAVNVIELDAKANAAASTHLAWAQGTEYADSFNAATDISAATLARMETAQRGVSVNLGAGDDTVVGSEYGDDISVGSGTNYVDGRANGGMTLHDGKAADVLRVTVASAAAAAAVQVTQLAAGMSGTDAQAFANGYTHKVMAGSEIDYVKGIERVTVQVAHANGNGGETWARDIALVVDVREADLGNPATNGYTNLAWVQGTAGDDVIDASGDTPLLTGALKNANAARGRGIWIDGDSGNDTITGTAYADTIVNGSGNSRIDGGKGTDTFQIQVASADEMSKVSVVPSDDPGYTWMVTYGAGSTQKDYLKNVESVVAYVQGGPSKWIPLGVNVIEVNPNATLSQYDSFAWARGTNGDDHFSAKEDVSTATQNLMAQQNRGVWVDLGAGNDTAVGSQYGDDISVGSGTNYVDGGANDGTARVGGKAQDVLRVTVASKAAADAVQVVSLADGASGADAEAFKAGYTHKVLAGAETDYIRNIEVVTIQVGTGSSTATWSRDIPLTVTVREADLSNPNTAGYAQLAWITGTSTADTIDASGDTALLSAALKNEMDASQRGVWIDGGAGNDTIIGTDYADTFRNGAGNSKIDGGNNVSADDKVGMDVFEIPVASVAELNAIQVLHSDDPAYQWMVTYGAGSTQKDYLKNVEAVNINVTGTSTGKWIPTGLNVYEISPTGDLDRSTWYVTARGSDLDEDFNGNIDVSNKTLALMAQHGRGVRVELGAGNNKIVGSPYGDDIVVVDKGTNWIDGGDNGGSPPGGGKAADHLIVMVGSEAAAAAVQVTRLAGPTGSDAGAYNQGYNYKVVNGAGVSYVKGIEHVLVQVNNSDGSAVIARDIPLSGIIVREVDVTDPATASSTYQAWVTGTADSDVIDARFTTSLLSNPLKQAMPARGHGIYIDGGAGNDDITGTPYSDTFVNGPGNSKIHGGGWLGGANGGLGRDVFEVKVASVAEMNAVRVSPSDDSAFRWMVTYDSTAGGQKDYLADIQGVRVTVGGSGETKWFQTGLTVDEVAAASDLAHTAYFATATGSVLSEGFDGTQHVTRATQALMAQYQRGVSVNMGDGDDWVVGSAYADDITVGQGINNVDGGANAAPSGSFAGDKLEVNVASAAAGDAVKVVEVTANGPGYDAGFYQQGYRFKVINGPGETDYIKNIELVQVNLVTDTGSTVLRTIDMTPTQAPTPAPTEAPTQAPTQAPTPAPTEAPTPAPTQAPTPAPTEAPTQAPTQAPTPAPTEAPTPAPTQAPPSANTPPSFKGAPPGVALSDFGSNFGALGGTALASGKLLSLSYGQAAPDAEKLLYLVRSNADGSIDTSFGNGTGRVLVPSTYDGGVAPVELADGKLAVAISTPGSNGHFKLMRLNADGSVDTAFGSNGASVVAFGSGKDTVHALLAGANGTLVAVGATTAAAGSSIVLARLKADGTPDTSFNGTGKVVLDVGSGVNVGDAVTLQADGKLVVAGTMPIEFGRLQGVVLRLNSDGTLDSSFGSGGKVALPQTSGELPATAVKVLADGKILVGGTYVASLSTGIAVLRLNANGSVDSTFGPDSNGTTKLHFGDNDDTVVDMLAQPDGKILVLSSTGTFHNSVMGEMAVTRLNADGRVDTTFGASGTAHISVHAVQDEPASLALSNGRILVFGSALNDADHNSSNIIAGLTSNGQLDPTFGTGNVSSLDNVALGDGWHPVALDSNATVFDADLAATNYGGATLTLQRQGGGNINDHFGGSGGVVVGAGGITVDGFLVGMGSLTDGALTITFNAQATQAAVSRVMHAITYTAYGTTLPAQPVVIDWTFSDGNTGAQGPDGAKSVTGSTAVKVGMVVHETVPSMFDPTLSAQHEPLASLPYLAKVNGTVMAEHFDSATGFSAAAQDLMNKYQHGARFEMLGTGDDVIGTAYGDEFSFGGVGVNTVDGGAQNGKTNGHPSRDVLDILVSDANQAAVVTATRLTDQSTGADHDAFLAGYTVKVVNGLLSTSSEVDYLKNVELVNIYGGYNQQLLRSISVGMQVVEIAPSPTDSTKDADGQPLSASSHFAWVTGSDLADSFNATTDISAATRALMDSNARGVEVRAGAGDDVIVGSTWSDVIEGGAGVNYIDGGSRAGSGAQPRDTLEVVVAPADAGAVKVSALTTGMSDATDAAAFAAGYTWKVVAGSETDYLKNIEAVDVLTWNDSNRDGQRDSAEVSFHHRIALAMVIEEVQVSATDSTKDTVGNRLADDPHFAWVTGTGLGEKFDATTDISAATRTLMDQYGHGVSVSSGGGGDTIVGSTHGDRVDTGAGTNYVDFGDQTGSAAHGAQAHDTLDVYATPADADAAKVVQLVSGMTDATDAAAYAAGYTWKIMAGAEIDYVKGIEELRVWSWNDGNHNGVRDAGEVGLHHRVPFSLVIDEVNVSRTDPTATDGGTPLAQLQRMAWVYGSGADDKFSAVDSQNAGGNISAATLALMNQYKVGVSIDSGAGNDDIVGTDWSDDVTLGAGVNKLDGRANGVGGAAPAEDTLNLYAASDAEAAAVTVTRLTGSMTGDDGNAFAAGYTWKVQNGSVETDYVKNVEKLNIFTWNDANHDGQREAGETTFVRSQSLVTNSAPTFSGVPSGIALTDAGYSMFAQGLTMLPDGKMVALSVTQISPESTDYGYMLTGYQANGAIDTNFGGFGAGGSGSTILPVTVAPLSSYALSKDVVQSAPVLLADGHMLIALSVTQDDGEHVALMRLESNGNPDSTFGTNGSVIVPSLSVMMLSQIVVQPDGKILVAGSSGDPFNSSISVSRFDASGKLDTTYNGSGTRTVQLEADSGNVVGAVALQPDGKLVIASTVGREMGVTRINADGTLDSAFGTGGSRVITPNSSFKPSAAKAVMLMGDGKILMAGYVPVNTDAIPAPFQVAMFRFDANGSPDTTYGVNGKLTLPSGGLFSSPQYMAVQPDGKILVAGFDTQRDSNGNSSTKVAVWRLSADGGSVDTTFGANGERKIDLAGGDDHLAGLAVTGNKIVILGAAGTDGGQHDNMALVRLNLDGSLDTTFNPQPPTTVGGFVTGGAINPIVLDHNAAIFDAEMTAANNYGGSSLTLARHGGANADDVFQFVGAVGIAGDKVTLNNIVVATYSQAGGTLTLTFLDGVTQAKVDSVLHGIAYTNKSANPPSSVTVDWTFADNDGTPLAAHASTTVNIALVEKPQFQMNNTTLDLSGNPLSAQNYVSIVDGTARGDTFNADLKLGALTHMVSDTLQRGVNFDSHGGGDNIIGTPYGDHFVLGAGVNYLDGNFNGGTDANGAAAQDVLEVFVKSQAEADAVTVTALSSQSTGADLTAFQSGYKVKVVAGAEIDYLKNVEVLQVSIWNDLDHDGVRDVSADASLNEVTTGAPHQIATLVGVPTGG